MEPLVSFSFELGHLKRTPRSGWHRAGVPTPESVAAHSWRVAVLALLIAHEEGGDAEHAAVLGLMHDVPEARTGDIGQVGKEYASASDPVAVANDQAAELPRALARHIVALVEEHEQAKTGGSIESLCSRDADKIECLLQAREYEQSGNQAVGRWADDMATAATTSTGKRLAQEARQADPAVWWENLTRLNP